MNGDLCRVDNAKLFANFALFQVDRDAGRFRFRQQFPISQLIRVVITTERDPLGFDPRYGLDPTLILGNL